MVKEFNGTDEPALPRVADELLRKGGFQHFSEDGLEGCDVWEEVIFFKQIKRGFGDGAGERITGEGVAVEECFSFSGIGIEGVEDFLGGHGDAEGHIAGGEAFGEAQEIGRDGFMLAGEHCCRCVRMRS